MCRLLRPLLALAAWCGLSATASAQILPDDLWLFSDEPLFPGLKQQELTEGWTYTAGGEFRTRYMDERNRLRPLGEKARNTYLLYRVAPYLELKHKDVALYIQGIDAESFGEDLPISLIDVNRTDLLQYYVDANLFDFEDGGQLHLKAGRQFLLYGSQHLVSPLAWANTWRNFDAVKLYYTSEAWNVDAFVSTPCNGAGAARQYHPYSRDEGDSSLTFSGVYATFKQLPHSTLDLYWLWLVEDDPLANRIDGDRHTVGARIAGSQPFFDGDLADDITATWDLEAAYQFGRDNLAPGRDLAVSAGFVSTNTGLTFTTLPWTPAVAGIFYYGTGDKDPTDDIQGTFNTLFPLGHAYWGQLDNFNGSNLRDAAVQVSLKPTERLSFVAQQHFLAKAQAADFIWNIAGVPFGDRTTPSTNLGQELDLVATMQFNKNLQVQAGYFWAWYGDAVTQDPAIAPRKKAEQFYLMTTWNF